MAIKDYKLPKKSIRINDDASFEVRGLSLPDITSIIDSHGPIISKFFDKYSGNLDSEQSDEELQVMGKILSEAAPELMCSIIAIAADEPDAHEQIMKLPFTIQIEALEAVGKLTFESSGGAKKAFEMVAKVILNLTGFAVELRTSKSSSMLSEKSSAS